MFPQLTDVWASVYAQIIIMLFIFALGIPALINQISLPEYIMRIRTQRRVTNRWLVYIPALVLIAFFSSFVLRFLHPCNHESLGEILCWVAALMMISAPLGIAIITIFIVKKSNIYATIADLERLSISDRPPNPTSPNPSEFRTSSNQPRKNPMTSSSSNTHNKPTFIVTDIIEDLIFIGGNAESGKDKQVVINSLKRIIEIKVNADYKGEEFTSLLRKFPDIVLGIKKGNEDDFKLIIKTLNVIIDLGKTNTNDYIAATDSLRRISIVAIGLDYINCVREVLALKIPNLVFDIGAEGLKSNPSLASEALNQLDTMYEEDLSGRCSNDTMSLYLGLIAHFWGGNEGMKMMGRRAYDSFLKSNKNIKAAFDIALDHHLGVSNFETYSCLSKLGKAKGVIKEKED